jgi:geranylgeranyl pyrophosphate synthase
MNPAVQQIIDRSLLHPVRQFTGRQGKRIRGSLVQLSYSLAGGRGDIPSPITDAVEYLHAGSLIIDDIQDASELRRGEPTLHSTHGVPNAINAGNWLYFRALESLQQAPLPSSKKTRLVEATITACRRCHEGQAIDLNARIDQISVADWEGVVAAISELKTGVLVELAVEIGCVSANGNRNITKVLKTFGRQIGMALQMRNDLEELYTTAAGVRSVAAEPNTRDDDLRNARVTWPWAWARQLVGEERCRALLRQLYFLQRDRSQIAGELFELTRAHGDRVISELIGEQVRVLGEHTLDGTVLALIREKLRPIEHPSNRPKAVAGVNQ